jgi:hypothetical protein
MRDLELVLVEGALEVRDVSDEDNPALVWASDDDADFLEDVMRGQEFVGERDLERAVKYLIAASVLTLAEAEHMEDFEETYEPAVAGEGVEDWDDDDAPHRQIADEADED